MKNQISPYCLYCNGKRVRGSKECMKNHDEAPVCSALGCDEPRFARSLCEAHDHGRESFDANGHYLAFVHTFETEAEYRLFDTTQSRFY